VTTNTVVVSRGVGMSVLSTSTIITPPITQKVRGVLGIRLV
jgi:hypothetical protein